MMSLYARVGSGGLVQEVVDVDADIGERFHPDIQWVAITAPDLAAFKSAQHSGRPLAITADGRLSQYAPTPNQSEIAKALRCHRHRFLGEALAILQRHITQREFGITTTLSDEEIAEWAAYAQALRDVPQQEGFPFTISWPLSPTP